VTARRVEGPTIWIVLAALAFAVLLNVGTLGSDPWAFETGRVDPRGPLGPLVRAADSEWDVGLLRSAAMCAGVLVALLAVAATLVRSWPRWTLVAAAGTVVALLVLPAVALQAGLRDATAPWFHVNDSTYQVELAGDMVLDGETPYGRDYSHTGMERFYSLDGTVTEETRRNQVALHHFAYFPGTALLGAFWRVLPTPWDDFRFLVALATIGLFAAAFAIPGPLWAQLTLGVTAAANPISVRGAWFGTADAPALLLLLLAFALTARRRAAWAGALLGGAILAKQFALVAVPFVAVMLLTSLGRAAVLRAATACGAVLLAGFLPFAIADPGALWADTVEYGADTYRIVGYGLSAILLQLGILEDRDGPYPFTLFLLLVWIPATALLVRAALRTGSDWVAVAGFAASMYLLLFLGRVFQLSYLVWPLLGVLVAGYLAAAGATIRRT
jgi:hypothetical protein